MSEDQNRNGETAINNNANSALQSANSIGFSSGDTIEDLTKEVEMLKQKLEEERAKFNDVACNFKIKQPWIFNYYRELFEFK